MVWEEGEGMLQERFEDSEKRLSGRGRWITGTPWGGLLERIPGR